MESTTFWSSLVNVLKDIFYFIINTLIDIAIFIIDLVFRILPANFFHIESFSNNTYNIISVLNWVFPTDTAVSCIGAVATAITLKASVGWMLRLARGIE